MRGGIGFSMKQHEQAGDGEVPDMESFTEDLPSVIASSGHDSSSTMSCSSNAHSPIRELENDCYCSSRSEGHDNLVELYSSCLSTIRDERDESSTNLQHQTNCESPGTTVNLDRINKELSYKQISCGQNFDLLKDKLDLEFSLAKNTDNLPRSSVSFPSVSLRNKQLQSKLYYDNELCAYRPPVRRTCSYPMTKVPKFGSFLIISEKEILLPTACSLSKKVRFADAFGFDLTSVQLIEDQDEPPVVPQYVFSELKIDKPSEYASAQKSQDFDYWMPQFPIRTTDTQLLKVFHKKIVLETIRIDACFLDATVLAHNCSLEKQIFMRCSSDGWKSSSDLAFHYIESLKNMCNVDRFALRTQLPLAMRASSCFEFAVCFQSQTGCFWDNNDSTNYIFKKVGAKLNC